MAVRTVPLVGGPVESRGAPDLETTAAGVMPCRLPAWTKEQYQDPSVYGVTVMPSGVRLVFRTDARVSEFEIPPAMEGPSAFTATVGSPRRVARSDGAQ